MDLALAIWHINPKATYRLDDSANPTRIIEWRGPGPKPTAAQLEESWQWWLDNPHWINPTHPQYDWLVWKRDQLTSSPPPSHIEVWEMIKIILQHIS